MKSVLPEWYEPDDATLEQILTTGTIALDANALLDLYRVNREQREEIMSVLRKVQDRIFVPYQAAFEFQKNRIKVVHDNEAAHAKLPEAIEFKTNIVQQIRDPSLRKEIQSAYDRFKKSYEKAINKVRREHVLTLEEISEHDHVREALDELLLQSSLAAEPTEAQLKKRKEEAKARNDAKIPPGFGDADEKDDASGDYLIWAELLDHSKKANRPLLFVTNDENKGDWYRKKIGGRSLGPRPELVAEMQKSSGGQPYHQVTLGSFLWLANEFLDAKVETGTIATVQNITSAPTIGSQPTYFPSIFEPSLIEHLQPLNLNRNFLAEVLAPQSVATMLRENPQLLPTFSELAQQNPNLASGVLQSPEMKAALAEISRDALKRILEGSSTDARLSIWAAQMLDRQTGASPAPEATASTETAGRSEERERPKKATAKKTPPRKRTAKKTPPRKTPRKSD